MRRTKLCKWAIRNTSFKWFHDVDDNGGEDGDYEHKDVNEIHIHRLLCTTWNIKEKFYFGRLIKQFTAEAVTNYTSEEAKSSTF